MDWLSDKENGWEKNKNVDIKYNSRIPEYDIAKGIGIILVIIGHTIPSSDYLHTFIYSFHMPLFFLVSGLVMKNYNKKRSLLEIICGERRLIASYVLYSLLYIVFDLIIRFVIMRTYGFNALFWDTYQTVCLFGINVLWFLSALLLAKILTYSIVQFCSKVLWQLLLGAGLYLFSSILFQSLHIQIENLSAMERILYLPIITILRAIEMSAFVLCGFAMKNYVERVIKYSRIFIKSFFSFFLLVNVVICFFTKSVDYHYMNNGIFILSFIMAFSGLFGILGISILVSNSKVISMIASFWGMNSLFVMVTHEYLLLKALTNLGINWLNIKAGTVLYMTLEILFLTFIEYILCLLIKQWFELQIQKLANTVEVIFTSIRIKLISRRLSSYKNLEEVSDKN